jgi:tRNA (guanine37-N1)-methyltransferase
MLQFDVLTIFPEIIQGAVTSGLLGKACQKGLISVLSHDLRDFTEDKHRRVDDVPYGGGPGMVIKPDPVVAALETVVLPAGRVKRILLSPRGDLLTQEKLRAYASWDQLILVCGRYEGIDERVLDFVDEEISIGDYILAGGEFAALVVIDSVSRLVPGVVGDPSSLEQESLTNGWLEYPQYTRPRVFRGREVPEVLLNGNHGEIAKWRREQSERLTRKRRPDLVKKARG